MEKPGWFGKDVDNKDFFCECTWIEHNFDGGFLDKVWRKFITEQTSTCIEVPAGFSNFNPEFPPITNSNAPLVVFRQKYNNYCVGYSWASALNYYLTINDKKKRSESVTKTRIHQFAKKISTSVDFKKDVMEFMKTDFVEYRVHCSFYLHCFGFLHGFNSQSMSNHIVSSCRMWNDVQHGFLLNNVNSHRFKVE